MSRCPQCAAAVPDAANWCSLCYADMHPAGELTSPDLQEATASPADPERALGSSPRVPGRHARPRQAAAVDHSPLTGTDLETQFQSLRPAPLTELPISDAELFALLRDEHGPDPLASWSQRFSNSRLRWAVAGGGALALVSILVLLASVFGSVLRN
ncbi:MAG: hypothetical protein WCJ42_09000 [Actinomycetes bacterium]